MEYTGKSMLRLPVVGWLVECAIHGLPDAKYYLFANCALVLAMAIYQFDYPLVITLALIMTAASLTLLVAMTAADAFCRANRQAPAGDANCRRGRPA